MVLNLYRQVSAGACLLPCGDDVNVGTNRAGHRSAKKIQDHLPEHEVARANRTWRRLVHLHIKRDVTLFEIVFGYTLDLLKDVSNFEIRSGLRKGALTNVVNLLEVKNAVKDAFRLI